MNCKPKSAAGFSSRQLLGWECLSIAEMDALIARVEHGGLLSNPLLETEYSAIEYALKAFRPQIVANANIERPEKPQKEV